MKIIFEDHKDTPSSKLISFLNQEDIVFAGANTRIVKCIRNIIRANPNEQIVVYIDLIPDNPITCEIFNRLTNDNLLNDNIVIMPVICAEYLIAKMICKYIPNVNVPAMRDIVSSIENNTNWRDIALSDFTNCKSLEKVFKRFFCEDSKYLADYYWNIAKNTNGFYSMDDTLTVEEKCKILWYSLPLYPLILSDSELLKRCNLIGNTVQWVDVVNILRAEVTKFTELFMVYGCEVLPMQCAEISEL